MLSRTGISQGSLGWHVASTESQMNLEGRSLTANRVEGGPRPFLEALPEP